VVPIDMAFRKPKLAKAPRRTVGLTRGHGANRLDRCYSQHSFGLQYCANPSPLGSEWRNGSVLFLSAPSGSERRLIPAERRSHVEVVRALKVSSFLKQTQIPQTGSLGYLQTQPTFRTREGESHLQGVCGSVQVRPTAFRRRRGGAFRVESFIRSRFSFKSSFSQRTPQAGVRA
jgi:hypothetical protein